MEHPDPAPMQNSCLLMGQAEDPPDETTGEVLQITLLTDYRGYCLQGRGAHCGIKADWWGMRMWKRRHDKRVQSHVNRLPVSMTGHVVCQITNLLIKLSFYFPEWRGTPFCVQMYAQRSKCQQMKRWPQIIEAHEPAVPGTGDMCVHTLCGCAHWCTLSLASIKPD